MRVRLLPRRRGFTLLEVVLAVGLGVFLAAGVYQVVAMHYAQVQAGRTVAEDAQALRGVARRLREDLWNTAFEWKPPAAVTQAAAAVDAAAATAAAGTSSTTTTTAAAETEAVNDYPGGIAGAANTLAIATRRMARDLNFDGSGGAVQTLRTVQYRVGAPQDGDASGLVREEYDLSPEYAAGATPLRSETLAPEVTAIAFRYYDGLAWTDAWDSQQANAPYAVEATLTVQLKRKTVDYPDGQRTIVVLVAPPGADLPAAAAGGS